MQLEHANSVCEKHWAALDVCCAKFGTSVTLLSWLNYGSKTSDPAAPSQRRKMPEMQSFT